MGLVDLHLHLLPAIDDGAKSVDEGVAMARALVSLGFDTLAPSPHHRAEYPSLSRDLCGTRLDEMRSALKNASVSATLYPNAENFFLEEAFAADLAAGAVRCVGPSRVVLVEAPYNGPLPSLLDLIFRMKLKGLTPLIAHPERCMEFEKVERARAAVDAGALLQLDVGALIGRYGKAAQKVSARLLGDGLYAIAATDLHSPVKAEEWVAESLKALRKAVGEAGVAQLFETTPRKILSGVGV
jgi:protein-tyrosine phosphatase